MAVMDEISGPPDKNLFICSSIISSSTISLQADINTTSSIVSEPSDDGNGKNIFAVGLKPSEYTRSKPNNLNSLIICHKPLIESKYI